MENYDCAGESFFSNNLVLVLPGAGASEADEDVSCEGVLNVLFVSIKYFYILIKAVCLQYRATSEVDRESRWLAMSFEHG